MQMDIYGLNFELTRPLSRHVERRVKLALAPALRSVTGVMVRLRDLNGPRGGADKRCRIAVWLRGRGTVIVDAVDRNLYAAVDAAAAKLREAVRRQGKRRRTLRREYASRRLNRQAAQGRRLRVSRSHPSGGQAATTSAARRQKGVDHVER